LILNVEKYENIPDLANDIGVKVSKAVDQFVSLALRIYCSVNDMFIFIP